jgi:hypothetical protein
MAKQKKKKNVKGKNVVNCLGNGKTHVKQLKVM